MKEIDELKAKIAEFQRKLYAFDDGIERAKEALGMKPSEWPQVGDEYWVGLADDSGIGSAKYSDDKVDAFLKSIGDMHRTEEEAEAYRKYRMNPRTVMRDKIHMWVNEYNGRERGVYFVCRSGFAGYTHFLSGLNSLSTKDPEGVYLLVKEFGLDNILWACGGPEPGGE